MSCIIEKDNLGRIIHHISSTKLMEEWRTFDDLGRMITYKRNEYEIHFEYTSEGKVVHSYDNTGYETWSEYNTEGELIKFISNKGTYSYIKKGD